MRIAGTPNRSERVAGATLLGWRAKVGDAVAPAVSKRTPLRAEQVRSIIGLVFVTLAATYVVRSVTRMVRPPET